MHHFLAPDLSVAGVTISLQDPFKFSQELAGTLSATIKLEIEHHRSQRLTVLPKVSLVILTFGALGLHIDRRFIILNIIAAQKLLTHRPTDLH